MEPRVPTECFWDSKIKTTAEPSEKTIQTSKKPGLSGLDIRGQTRRMEKLFTHLDGSLHALGFSGSPDLFHPISTLARIKVPVHSRKIVSLMETCKDKWSDDFHAQCMNLYKSRLTSAGAIHTRLFYFIKVISRYFSMCCLSRS
jgi:2'-5' RNA ligase